jgi:hypothetical protein
MGNTRMHTYMHLHLFLHGHLHVYVCMTSVQTDIIECEPYNKTLLFNVGDRLHHALPYFT